MSFERHQPKERWNRLERIRLDLAALREAFPPLAERKDEAHSNSFQNGRNGQGSDSNEVHKLKLSREERLENIQRKLSTASTGRRFVNGQAELYSATLYDSDASASPIGLGQETASAWFEQYKPQAKDTTKDTQNLAESWQVRLDSTGESRCRQLQRLQQLQQQSSMVQDKLQQTKGAVEATVTAATKRCLRDAARDRVQSALNEAKSPRGTGTSTSQWSHSHGSDATKMAQRFEVSEFKAQATATAAATATASATAAATAAAHSSTAREAQSDGSGDGGIFNSVFPSRSDHPAEEWVTKLLSATPPTSRKSPEVYLHPQVTAVPPVNTACCETTCGSVDWQDWEATVGSGTPWSATARRSASPARSASPGMRPASKYAIPRQSAHGSNCTEDLGRSTDSARGQPSHVGLRWATATAAATATASATAAATAAAHSSTAREAQSDGSGDGGIFNSVFPSRSDHPAEDAPQHSTTGTPRRSLNTKTPRAETPRTARQHEDGKEGDASCRPQTRRARIRELLKRLNLAQTPCMADVLRVDARQRQAKERHLRLAGSSSTPSTGALSPALSLRRSRSFMDLIGTSEENVSASRSSPVDPRDVEDVIARLPAKVATTTRRGEPCTICLEIPTSGEVVTTLPCCHWYHTECIREWLLHARLCPLCKTVVVPEELGI